MRRRVEVVGEVAGLRPVALRAVLTDRSPRLARTEGEAPDKGHVAGATATPQAG